MYCKNCGKEVEDGQELCVNCRPADTKVEEVVVEEVVTEVNGPIKETVVAETVNQNQTNSNNVSENAGFKSRMAAGLFGIFLGAFGVHNFYLGYTGKAVAQLLITVLTCGMLSFVSGIWGLVEGILILTDKSYVDAEGNLLKD